MKPPSKDVFAQCVRQYATANVKDFANMRRPRFELYAEFMQPAFSIHNINNTPLSRMSHTNNTSIAEINHL
jgi:hypothetical protein